MLASVAWNRYDIPLLLMFPALTVLACLISITLKRREELFWHETSIFGIVIVGTILSVMAAMMIRDAHGVGSFECWMSESQCGPPDRGGD